MRASVWRRKGREKKKVLQSVQLCTSASDDWPMTNSKPREWGIRYQLREEANERMQRCNAMMAAMEWSRRGTLRHWMLEHGNSYIGQQRGGSLRLSMCYLPDVDVEGWTVLHCIYLHCVYNIFHIQKLYKHNNYRSSPVNRLITTSLLITPNHGSTDHEMGSSAPWPSSFSPDQELKHARETQPEGATIDCLGLLSGRMRHLSVSHRVHNSCNYSDRQRPGGGKVVLGLRLAPGSQAAGTSTSTFLDRGPQHQQLPLS